jgi:predicted nuclease of predicted toxin-antitoxin system
VTNLSEVAQLEAVIDLQVRALAQHAAAEEHWTSVGDTDRTDAAIWRQAYVSALLVQLRSDLAAVA